MLKMCKWVQRKWKNLNFPQDASKYWWAFTYIIKDVTEHHKAVSAGTTPGQRLLKPPSVKTGARARARTHTVSKLRFRCGSVACFSSRRRLLFQTAASFQVSWNFTPFPRTFCSLWSRTSALFPSLFQHLLLPPRMRWRRAVLALIKPLGQGRGSSYRGRDLSCVEALPVLCSAFNVRWSDLSSTSKKLSPLVKLCQRRTFQSGSVLRGQRFRPTQWSWLIASCPRWSTAEVMVSIFRSAPASAFRMLFAEHQGSGSLVKFACLVSYSTSRRHDSPLTCAANTNDSSSSH